MLDYDKMGARAFFLKDHPEYDVDGALNNSSTSHLKKITPEMIKEFIQIYHYNTNRELGNIFGLPPHTVQQVTAFLKKEGRLVGKKKVTLGAHLRKTLSLLDEM